MVKNALLAMLELVLFVALFFWGSIKAPLGWKHVIAVTRDGTHAFYWDGLVLMTLLFIAILAFEAARKRIRSSGGWTVLAFALATVVAVKVNFLAFTR